MEIPSYMQQAVPGIAAPAWASSIYGATVDCPRHGRQIVIERTQEDVGMRYDDGNYDSRFSETLGCGCQVACERWRDDIQRHF